jgi:hypothetical protein
MEGLPMSWRLGLALAWFGATACGSALKPAPTPKYQLEGSLSVLVELGFDQAHLELSEGSLAVRYVRVQGEGEDTVLKLTADVADLELVAGATLDLAQALPSGAQRGVVSRDVLDDPRRSFPRLQRGRLILDRVPVVGEEAVADLAVTFENGTELASGRTVFGKFKANVP